MIKKNIILIIFYLFLPDPIMYFTKLLFYHVSLLDKVTPLGSCWNQAQ